MHLLSAILLAAAPVAVQAQINAINPCPVPGVPCVNTGGVAGAVAIFANILVPAIRIAFIGLLVLLFFYYALRMILESEEESTITDSKNAYSNAIVGAAMVSLASMIVEGFGQSSLTNDTLVNSAPVITGLSNVILYIRLMVGTSASALIAFQGIRIVLLQGQESEIEQQRKRFFHGLLGIAVILLANSLVNAVLPGANSGVIAEETRGITNFMLEIFGFLAVLSFVVAGIFLVVSTEEALKDRAKKILFGTTIAIIIVMCAYVITNFFLTI